MKTFPKDLISSLFLGLCQLAVVAAPPGWVVGWGANVSGEATGVPYSGQSTGLVMIAGEVLTNAVAVVAGRSHSLAIRSNGTVVGWGDNSSRQTTGLESAYPYRTSGVVTVGGQILSNVVEISTAWSQSFAIKGDSTVAAWGTKFDGGKIQIAPGLSNVVSIAAEMGLAVKNDGTVVDVFNNQAIEGLSNVVVIIAPFIGNGGRGAMVVLKRDGTIMGGRLHGVTPFGQIQGISNAVAIAVGDQEGFALKSDGTIAAWYHPDEIPTGLSKVVAIAAGKYHGFALKKDGTVVAWGNMGFQRASVPEGLSNVVAIAAGDNFCLAITTNRAVAERFMPKSK
jgi:alpha-tubulin suppressor-like RCC1 family protein